MRGVMMEGLIPLIQARDSVLVREGVMNLLILFFFLFSFKILVSLGSGLPFPHGLGVHTLPKRQASPATL